jgi:hypothetical protein
VASRWAWRPLRAARMSLSTSAGARYSRTRNAALAALCNFAAARSFVRERHGRKFGFQMRRGHRTRGQIFPRTKLQCPARFICQDATNLHRKPLAAIRCCNAARVESGCDSTARCLAQPLCSARCAGAALGLAAAFARLILARSGYYNSRLNRTTGRWNRSRITFSRC